MYKRYFRKYRPRRLAMGKPTGHEVLSGSVDGEVMTTIYANYNVGAEKFTVTPFYHNFIGFGDVVNQPYGICGAYGNQELRAAFARYQQVRVKGMYLRVRVENVHMGETTGVAGYLDRESIGTSYIPYVVWDRQAQLKDVDCRDYDSTDAVQSASSQGMPLWYNRTDDVWETKCVPKDLAERTCWIDTTTSYATGASGGKNGQRPIDWYTDTTGQYWYDYMCQNNYFGNNNLARTIPPAQFNPLATIVLKTTPLTVNRDILVRISVKYILEFRNPGWAQTPGVRDALLFEDTALGPRIQT